VFAPNGQTYPCTGAQLNDPLSSIVVSIIVGSGGLPCTPGKPPAVADPQSYAVEYWRTVPLPVPHPGVPPGYAVTGKYAYLVTGGTVGPQPFVYRTPLGLLTITATGSYAVDWGDGSQPTWDGPFAFEGTAWPTGRIQHVYDTVGRYRLVVVENWTARWSLAGAAGVLDGLQTTAVIPAFEVRQVQAVIGY
jgi:hypothetical protein